MLPLKLGRTCKSLVCFGARLREPHGTSLLNQKFACRRSQGEEKHATFLLELEIHVRLPTSGGYILF